MIWFHSKTQLKFYDSIINWFLFYFRSWSWKWRFLCSAIYRQSFSDRWEVYLLNLYLTLIINWWRLTRSKWYSFNCWWLYWFISLCSLAFVLFFSSTTTNHGFLIFWIKLSSGHPHYEMYFQSISCLPT